MANTKSEVSPLVAAIVIILVLAIAAMLVWYFLVRQPVVQLHPSIGGQTPGMSYGPPSGAPGTPQEIPAPPPPPGQ